MKKPKIINTKDIRVIMDAEIAIYRSLLREATGMLAEVAEHPEKLRQASGQHEVRTFLATVKMFNK